MNLPSRITTKAEALRLAAEVFPGTAAALAQIPAEISHPRYELSYTTTDRLRELLYWLHETRPTIYKRARWHFFYDLAFRLVKQVDENGSLKWADIDHEQRHRARVGRLAAETFSGDGAGI